MHLRGRVPLLKIASLDTMLSRLGIIKSQLIFPGGHFYLFLYFNVTQESALVIGTANGTRTRVSAVRGRRANRCTIAAPC